MNRVFYAVQPGQFTKFYGQLPHHVDNERLSFLYERCISSYEVNSYDYSVWGIHYEVTLGNVDFVEYQLRFL